MKDDLFIEIGLEEMPSSEVMLLSEAFSSGVLATLKQQRLSHSDVATYATPRRIALWIKSLQRKAQDIDKVVWGPSVDIAFKENGLPSKAGEVFAERNNLETVNLKEFISFDGKQDKLRFKQVIEGRLTKDVVEDLINQVLSKLPFKKRMRWGTNRLEFVRPVHWVVLLYGKEVLRKNILGINSGAVSRGHRFHASKEIVIKSGSSYEQQLYEHHVVASVVERRRLIIEGVQKLAIRFGGIAVMEPSLIDEVVAITEWPVPLLGYFDKDFLKIPEEALISAMRRHQKYFHIVDKNGKLMAAFITVANIDSADPAQVVTGNERVLRARLADAVFFFENDCKSSLEAKRQKLSGVVYQAQLGSVLDKTERLVKLCHFLSDTIGSAPDLAARAAAICKADLVSDMVGEFEDLQGIMGGYYAQNDNEKPQIATAIREHYLPRFAGDKTPKSAEGITLAIADRLDTLIGTFIIDQQPSGSKDPFAIRRACVGLLNIILENDIDIDLREAIKFSGQLISDNDKSNEACKSALTYVLGRFISIYKDKKISIENFKAVATLGLSNPLDINRRVLAISQFSQLPDAGALIAANKRVVNILSSATSQDLLVDATMLREPAEIYLFKNLEEKKSVAHKLISQKKYEIALKELASLREPVDEFFEKVLVMEKEPQIRRNRLALLQELRQLFCGIADFSLLTGVEGD